MKKTSTKSKNKGKAERLLLVAILAIGVLGLTFSYGTKHDKGKESSASSIDSTNSDGKVQSDRMILHLNKRAQDREAEKEISRF